MNKEKIKSEVLKEIIGKWDKFWETWIDEDGDRLRDLDKSVVSKASFQGGAEKAITLTQEKMQKSFEDKTDEIPDIREEIGKGCGRVINEKGYRNRYCNEYDLCPECKSKIIG